MEGRSSTGMEPNVAAGLSYLFGCGTGLIFLLLEKENEFVRFHAAQSLVVFGALFVISLVAGVIPIIGPLISVLLFLVSLALWLVLMIQAFQGKRVEIPIAADFAKKIAGSPSTL